MCHFEIGHFTLGFFVAASLFTNLTFTLFQFKSNFPLRTFLHKTLYFIFGQFNCLKMFLAHNYEPPGIGSYIFEFQKNSLNVHVKRACFTQMYHI